MKLVLFAFAFVFANYVISLGAESCHERLYGEDSLVCVCNSSYCDRIAAVEPLRSDHVAVYVTSIDGDRLKKTEIQWNDTTGGVFAKAIVKVVVDPTKKFQTVIGFGGAFTDAASINIHDLSAKLRHQFLDAYFGDNGLRYSMARVPVASCDFSTRAYSYNEVADDFDMEHFSLSEEDFKFKIPAIQDTLRLRNGDLKLLGSAWSAPPWMKTSGVFTGNGTLKGGPGGPYYKAWALYYRRFLEKYLEYNISFWGLTTQNEPTTGYLYKHWFQAMGFRPEMQRDFIKLDLGPALKGDERFRDVKLLILDDQRLMLPQWAKVVLGDAEAAAFVDGVALHWYGDYATPKLLDATHDAHPTKFLLGSEACSGFIPGLMFGPRLGLWIPAEQYAADIIEDMNHWVAGWMEWNLALDTGGGPSWVHNYIDAPIIVNATADEFYKQPSYYAIGHFSAFVPSESVRVGIKVDGSDGGIIATAFVTPDHYRVLVVLNREKVTRRILISEAERGTENVYYEMKSKSIATFIWKQK